MQTKALFYRLFSTFLVLSLSFFNAHSQDQPLDISFEFQAYPTGLIPGIHIEKGFGTNAALHLRLGYNIIDHGEFGVQDDETGQGYGFTLGYRRFLREGFDGLFLGLRNDIWFNTIDWQNQNTTTGVLEFGTTEITVVQPTAELGSILLNKNGFIFTGGIAFGREINVVTNGEPTGQGWIFLAGVSLGIRL